MNKQEEIREWFNFAYNDFVSAKFLTGLKPMPFEIICYHCQQSAEKYIKGFLISKDVSIASGFKTHDLNLLLEKCLEFEKEFIQIEEECKNLTDYAVPARYPGNIEINKNDVEEAIKNCETIKLFIESKTKY
jgi:HEPN domain-containing protein